MTVLSRLIVDLRFRIVERRKLVQRLGFRLTSCAVLGSTELAPPNQKRPPTERRPYHLMKWKKRSQIAQRARAMD